MNILCAKLCIAIIVIDDNDDGGDGCVDND